MFQVGDKIIKRNDDDQPLRIATIIRLDECECGEQILIAKWGASDGLHYHHAKYYEKYEEPNAR